MKVVLAIIAIVVLVALVLFVIGLAVDNARLRRRMKGLEEPELWLPRKERRAHARKLLQREDDEYQQQMIDRIMSGTPLGTHEKPKGTSK